MDASCSCAVALASGTKREDGSENCVATHGAVIGLASGDDPPGFLSFTAEEKAALGAFVFGGLGGVIGLIAGTASPGERWEEVPLVRLRVGFAPQRDGRLGIGASVRF